MNKIKFTVEIDLDKKESVKSAKHSIVETGLDRYKEEHSLRVLGALLESPSLSRTEKLGLKVSDCEVIIDSKKAE